MGLFKLCHICVLLFIAILLVLFFSSINRTNPPSRHTSHHSNNHIDTQSLANQNAKSMRHSFHKVHTKPLKQTPSLVQLNQSTNATHQSTNPSINQPIRLHDFDLSVDRLTELLSGQNYRSNRGFSGRSLLIDTSQFHSVFKQSDNKSDDITDDDSTDQLKENSKEKSDETSDERSERSTKQSSKSSSDSDYPSNQFLVPLHDSYHVMYTAQISVGTPGQLIDVVLDTGSSCLWVVSADLELDESTKRSIERSREPSIDPSPHRSKEEARHRAYHSQQQPATRSNKQSHIPSYLQSYDHTLSSTYQPIDEPWSIQYGVGECSGYLSMDTVSLHPGLEQSIDQSDEDDDSTNQSISQSSKQLRVMNQTFAETTKLSSNFFNSHQSLSGIVGLSFRGGSCSSWPTLIDNLYDESVISHKMFSFQLSAEYEELSDDSKERPINQMILGAPDKSLYRDELIWIPVLHAPNQAPAMWFVRLDHLSMTVAEPINQSINQSNDQPLSRDQSIKHRRTKNDRLIHRKLSQLYPSLSWSFDAHTVFHSGSARFCSPSSVPCIALPDSGTSFLTLPPKLFVALVSLVTHGRDDCMIDDGANVFCLNGPKGLPILEFTFHDRTFGLSPYDYMLPNQQLAIQVLDFGVDDLQILILGDVFLRSVYTVFDTDKQQIGFAQSIQSNSSYQSSRAIYEHEIVRSQRLALIFITSLVILFLCCTCCLCYFIVNGCSFQWRSRQYEEI